MGKTDRLTLADVHADVVSVVQAAEITSVSKDILYEAIRRGEFPHRKIGARIVVPVALLREWLGIAPSQTGPESNHLQLQPTILGGPVGPAVGREPSGHPRFDQR